MSNVEFNKTAVAQSKTRDAGRTAPQVLLLAMDDGSVVNAADLLFIAAGSPATVLPPTVTPTPPTTPTQQVITGTYVTAVGDFVSGNADYLADGSFGPVVLQIDASIPEGSIIKATRLHPVSDFTLLPGVGQTIIGDVEAVFNQTGTFFFKLIGTNWVLIEDQGY